MSSSCFISLNSSSESGAKVIFQNHLPSQEIIFENIPVKRDILFWLSDGGDRTTKLRLAIIELNTKQKGRVCL